MFTLTASIGAGLLEQGLRQAMLRK